MGKIGGERGGRMGVGVGVGFKSARGAGADCALNHQMSSANKL